MEQAIIIATLAEAVKTGKMTLDQVPETLREEVSEKIVDLAQL